MAAGRDWLLPVRLPAHVSRALLRLIHHREDRLVIHLTETLNELHAVGHLIEDLIDPFTLDIRVMHDERASEQLRLNTVPKDGLCLTLTGSSPFTPKSQKE